MLREYSASKVKFDNEKVNYKNINRIIKKLKTEGITVFKLNHSIESTIQSNQQYRAILKLSQDEKSILIINIKDK